MQAYTKARKTQHARIRYNSHIENYKEKHYEPWKESAEKARDSFKENNDIISNYKNNNEKFINDIIESINKQNKEICDYLIDALKKVQI